MRRVLLSCIGFSLMCAMADPAVANPTAHDVIVVSAAQKASPVPAAEVVIHYTTVDSAVTASANLPNSDGMIAGPSGGDPDYNQPVLAMAGRNLAASNGNDPGDENDRERLPLAA